MSEKLWRGNSVRMKFLLIGLVFGEMFICFQEARAKSVDESGKLKNLSVQENYEISLECDCSSEICFKKDKNQKSERQIYYEEILSGFPLEQMAEDLSVLQEDVADFMIAIAKKESQWGTHSPSVEGRDCYNYWGYKGKEEKQILGYSCFSSKEEAVKKVGSRIQNLIQKGLNTPEKFVIWKCGSSCAEHNPQSVAKWIADVKSVLRSLRSKNS